LHHAFTRGVQPAAVFGRTMPERFFQTGRGLRTGSATASGRFEFEGLAFSLDVVDALFDRCIIARFRSLGDLGGRRIQIDIDRCL
jgi:hypothetical protein